MADTHKVIKTEVVPLDCKRYGVRFWFDDGTEDFAEAESKNSAEFYAREQFGENLVFGVHPFLLNAEKAAKLRRRASAPF
jgi:hypothetical protein